MLGVSVAFQRLALRGRKFTIASLFASGQGGFLRTSDLVYSDTAATTPANLEDSVAAWGDLSPNANLSVQATSTARGVLSGRYNLLQQSDGFRSGIITPATGLVEVATGLADPRGGTTARQFRNTTTTEQHRLFFQLNVSGRYEYSVEVKDVDAGFVQLSYTATVSNFATTVNLSNGTFNELSTIAAKASVSVEDIEDGFKRITITPPSEATAVVNIQLYVLEANIDIINPLTTGTEKSVIFAGVQVRPVDQNTTSLPPYQRVGNLTADPDDYDTVGFPEYVRMDAFDDVYPQTIDAVTGGTVILATSQGIWIDTLDASAGTWSLGPTAYTGGPSGLLTALKSGDHVKVYGYAVLDYAISASQRAGIVQYYRNRGAGPEIEDYEFTWWDSATDTYGGAV